MLPPSYYFSTALGVIVLVLFFMERRGTTGEFPNIRDSLIVLANAGAAAQVAITSISLVLRLGNELGSDGFAFVTIGGFVLFSLPVIEVWNRFQGK